MTPNAPTFTEARDAVLAAAFANDPVDGQRFAQAFAKRGAGRRAVSPDRYSVDHSGVVESFTTGGDLTLISAIVNDNIDNCDHDGILDNNETGTLTVMLKNNGTTNLSNTTGMISSSNPSVQFPNGGAITFPASQPFQNSVASVRIKLVGATGIPTLPFNISFSDTGFGVPGAINSSISVYGNYDEISAVSATDSVENSNVVWTADHNPSLNGGDPWARGVVNTGPNHVWHGPDSGTGSDQYLISPALNVAPTGNFTFTFSHRYSFEADGGGNYDGGLVEISTNNGMSWTNIGASLSAPYAGALIVYAGNPNPLQGQTAYVGTSGSYPGFSTVTANLGTAYQGQTVKIRFRIGTDAAAGAAGWDIDDLTFNNITNTPFGILVAETGGVCTGPPFRQPFDFDGDHVAGVATYNPSTNQWSVINSGGSPQSSVFWGSSGDILVPSDYDGDGKTDIAVFRPSDGNWYILRSSDNTVTLQNWGGTGDIPVPGDYDGDLKSDVAVYRPSEGNWYVRQNTGGSTVRNWGTTGDKVVPGDYDGDGKIDISVWRPSEGTWYIIRSSNNTGAVV